MTTLKNEIELRDMKMQHQLEMNEMQIRVSMLEMQKELVDKISKCKNDQTAHPSVLVALPDLYFCSLSLTYFYYLFLLA
jgi:hypothetical protein